jgi:polysaccharide deacetylase
MKLFYNYSIDCELPPEGPFGGPATWEEAEQSVRGFIEVMDGLGLRQGATLFVYPDVAIRQRTLFRDMAESGIEVALHLNGMRYSRVSKPAWLGSMSREDQHDALRMAKADLEDVIGQPCLGYRACYASANHDTFPICEDLGFQWTSTSAAGSYKPDVFARWSGGWPFPYHPSSKNMLVPGDMRIYEMPIARGIRTMLEGDPDRPLDLRAETPPETVGPDHMAFRQVIQENLTEMARRNQPVRGLFPGSHNTNPFADTGTHPHANLVAVCELTRELAEADGYEFVPAPFTHVKAEADSVSAF